MGGVCVGASNYIHAPFKVDVSNGAKQYGTPTSCSLTFTEHTASKSVFRLQSMFYANELYTKDYT